MLWFKYIFALKIFKPVWFLFPFVWDNDIEFETVKNKNKTSLKNIKPKKNLNHHMYT